MELIGDYRIVSSTSATLSKIVDPNHLLKQIDPQLDFAKMVVPLEERYCPDVGRPAIHRITRSI